MICAVIGDWLFRYCRHRATKVAAIYVYLVCLAPALLHWLELFHGTMLMLLPLLGKSGTFVPPDIAGSVIFNRSHRIPHHSPSPAGMFVSLFTFVFFQHILVPYTRRSHDEQKSAAAFRPVLFATVIILGTAYFLPPYTSSHPKRLWVQHCTREFCDSLRCRVDSGLWVTAFDGRGLAPLRSTGIKKLDGRYDAPPCNPGDGACYALYPWSYPVGDVMRDSFFIPASPPDIPPHQRLSLNVSSSFDGNKRVLAVLRGSHIMRLVIRDGKGGGRLICWEVLEGGGCTKPPPPREDGSRYTQLLCGDVDENCVFQISMTFAGSDPVELTAHADYVTLTKTPELEQFRSSLPIWSTGAEWTNFASALVSKIA